MKRENIRTIIFDLDGTLFQTEKLAIPAFYDTIKRLKEEELYNGDMPSEEHLKSQFGKVNDEIWPDVLPGASKEVIEKANEYMEYYELTRLKKGQGNPYPGVTRTLKALHNHGYRLCIASNGGKNYVHGVAEFHFPGLFTEVYSAGGQQTETKVDMVKIIKERFDDGPMVMVGDRSSDIAAGKENGFYSIGCTYGFSSEDELAQADHIIKDFTELKEIFIID